MARAGALVIIGGAEDKGGGMNILAEVVRLAGEDKARIAIIAAASSNPSSASREYVEAFESLGCQRAWPVDIACRRDALEPLYVRLLEDATGIFFTGGDQLRITSLLGGTPLYNTLHTSHRLGAVVAGTSAGASVMSDTMIVEGLGDEAPRKCTTKMAPGMGFLKDVVVDQHFAQRGRIGRLLGAIAENPHVLGLGVDEDTAAVVSPGGILQVIGSQAVTILDGHSIEHSNTSEQAPEEPLAITSVVLHILPSGYGFDLRRRRVLFPQGSRDAHNQAVALPQSRA